MNSEWISTCPLVHLEIRSKQERFIVLCLTSTQSTIKDGGDLNLLGRRARDRLLSPSPRLLPLGCGGGTRGSEESKSLEMSLVVVMMQEDMAHHEGWSPKPLWNYQGLSECCSKLEIRPFLWCGSKRLVYRETGICDFNPLVSLSVIFMNF